MSVVKKVIPLWVKIATVSLAAAFILSMSLAYVSYDRGSSWAERAANSEIALEEARVSLEESAGKIDDLQESLYLSERDVKELEERLTLLADEKAQAKDEAAQATLSAAALYELTRSATSVTTLMSRCIAYQDRWTDVLVNVASGALYDRTSIDAFISEMSSTCESAQASAEALRSIVDGL